MTSTQDYAVQRCMLGSGINLPFRCSDWGSFPRSPAPGLHQHNRDAAAGLGCSDAEVDAVARDGLLHAEAAG